MVAFSKKLSHSNRKFPGEELGQSNVLKVSLISGISYVGVLAALAGAAVVPAFSQAQEGRQQRGTGEAPAARSGTVANRLLSRRRFKPCSGSAHVRWRG